MLCMRQSHCTVCLFSVWFQCTLHVPVVCVCMQGEQITFVTVLRQCLPLLLCIETPVTERERKQGRKREMGRRRSGEGEKEREKESPDDGSGTKSVQRKGTDEGRGTHSVKQQLKDERFLSRSPFSLSLSLFARTCTGTWHWRARGRSASVGRRETQERSS